jgi:O-antigen/teichoic acid export membrane protein
VAVTETERGRSARLSLGAAAAGFNAWRSGGSDRTMAQRIAGAAVPIRVASAAIIYLAQILLARWMGRLEFGIYVYVWAWVGFLGLLSPLGVAHSAQHFIPEYRTLRDDDRLRGFLLGSRWLCLALGAVAAALLAGTVALLADAIAAYYVLSFMVASLALPIFAVSSAQDSIARAFNWIDLALIPGFIVHPLLIVTAMAAIQLFGGPVTALHGLIAACAALWLVGLAQVVLLGRRLESAIATGQRRYEVAEWLKTSLPILLADSFFILLTYVGILVLQVFVGPADVAVYYAAAKTLVVVSFIRFAVGTASAHRFSEHHAAGEKDQLARLVTHTIRQTFWPSLVLVMILVAVGKPLLALFGPGFEDGYPLLLVLSIGLIARASVGPSERLLNMIGEQSACAFIYGCAFATNLVLCLVLVPRFGILGAACATATAIVCESILVIVITKRRLGLNTFIFSR